VTAPRDGLPQHVLRGGHFAEMADYAARRVLAAWDRGLAAYREPDAVRELAAAMELLRDVHPNDPPEDFDPRPYIASQTWVFAKTMPEHPHEYVVISRSTNWRGHLRMLLWIRLWGHEEKYQGRSYQYRVVDAKRYWAMGPNDTIINRREEP
jgi:hypothetical protein